ncbi:MAG TPA: hypothetical protein GX528_04645 [Firmicutes bacterium]|nr:hypothetical protein [Bacillota bacterium]
MEIIGFLMPLPNRPSEEVFPEQQVNQDGCGTQGTEFELLLKAFLGQLPARKETTQLNGKIDLPKKSEIKTELTERVEEEKEKAEGAETDAVISQEISLAGLPQFKEAEPNTKAGATSSAAKSDALLHLPAKIRQDGQQDRGEYEVSAALFNEDSSKPARKKDGVAAAQPAKLPEQGPEGVKHASVESTTLNPKFWQPVGGKETFRLREENAAAERPFLKSTAKGFKTVHQKLPESALGPDAAVEEVPPDLELKTLDTPLAGQFKTWEEADKPFNPADISEKRVLKNIESTYDTAVENPAQEEEVTQAEDQPRDLKTAPPLKKHSFEIPKQKKEAGESGNETSGGVEKPRGLTAKAPRTAADEQHAVNYKVEDETAAPEFTHETNAPPEKLDPRETQEFFPKIVKQIESLVKDERSEVRIQLKPDYLGEMKIKIALERGLMTAEFVVENERVREIIAANLPHLRTALQSQGGNVAQMAVNVDVGQEHLRDNSPQPQAANPHRITSAGKVQFGGKNSKAQAKTSPWHQVDLRA